jgi:hypothetical protein
VLHVCPACGSRLVQAETWSHPEPEVWLVGLRCPECAWAEAGRFARAAVEAFLDESDRAFAAVHVQAEQLDRDRFEQQVERFIEALDADAIDPMDF